jgi:plastocyanin
LAGLCAGSFGAARAPAATLSGILVLQERGRPAADLAGAMVYFTPEAGVTPVPAPIAAEIVMRDRRFSPRTIAVPVGSTVRFGNADPIRHNVFSVSPGNRFDLGLYGEGPGRAQRFDRPGLARIFCNVHRTMSAYVMVLDTPFHRTPDAAGRFTLEGLPEGPGTLHVWHPRAEAWSRPVRLPVTEAVLVTLEATLPVVPPHLDKHGRPYRETADDERYR